MAADPLGVSLDLRGGQQFGLFEDQGQKVDQPGQLILYLDDKWVVDMFDGAGQAQDNGILDGRFRR